MLTMTDTTRTIAYVTRLAGGKMLYAELPEDFVSRDRSGHLLLRPAAVRVLDQARALAVNALEMTPAYLATLRQALGLTQAQFGRMVGVDKMTVSRWERGTRKPGVQSARRIIRLKNKRIASSPVLQP